MNILSGAELATFEGALHNRITIFQANVKWQPESFSKGSLKRSVNQDSKSGSDFVRYRSDSAGDGTYQA